MSFEDFNSFEEMEKEEDVLKIPQEDFDSLQKLLSEDIDMDTLLDPESEALHLFELYKLELEEGGVLDVEVGGKIDQLYGVKRVDIVDFQNSMDGDIEMPEAA